MLKWIIAPFGLNMDILRLVKRDVVPSSSYFCLIFFHMSRLFLSGSAEGITVCTRSCIVEP